MKNHTYAFLFFCILICITATWLVLVPGRSNGDAVMKAAEGRSLEHSNDYGLAIAELQRIDERVQLYRRLIEEAVREKGPHSPDAERIPELQHYNQQEDFEKVRQIITRYGWLPADLIGAKNSYTLFATVEKADIAARASLIPSMLNAVEQGTLSPHSFAELADRTLLALKGEQWYGTQLRKDSLFRPLALAPVAEPEQLNSRRREIGLEPIEAYAAAQWLALR